MTISKYVALPVLGLVLFAGCNPGVQEFGSAATIPGVSLNVASVPNLRDLGGYTTDDGQVVASRLVYRANQLSGISEIIEAVKSCDPSNSKKAIADRRPQSVYATS